MLSVVCMPGAPGSFAARAPGIRRSSSSRAAAVSRPGAGAGSPGGTVLMMKRDPFRGGYHASAGWGAPSSGKAGRSSRPHSRKKAQPGISSEVMGSTSRSSTTRALPWASCPVTTRRIVGVSN